ncbi:hypothetical protein Ddye_019977 [Dipteronia dyeriana]|uniref:non-specific serine/threonine protein kinase n=1 Tax=Dipteronia dyeriana TaxID=168575 RepID=A0AAD9TZ30_9ROSI|nr:hypothetical protein Ddye_019977 [Dipteronia dyeriana]
MHFEVTKSLWFFCSITFSTFKGVLRLLQFSSMVSKLIIIIILFQIFIFSSTKAETWTRAAYYWSAQKEFPISNINSSLFTHLICGFAYINSTSYELFFSQSDEKRFSTFTETVKKKNPSVTTLLSIGGGNVYDSTFSSMVGSSLSRTSFIYSSIEKARRYGFQGLDLWWAFPSTSDDMDNIGLLFKEWREAITVEATNSTKTKLILTAVVNYFPTFGPQNYPVDSIQKYLDWVHVRNGNYFLPNYWTNFTAAPMALFNPNSTLNNTDYGIRSWIDAGLSPKKMVLFLPYYGSAWTLKNPIENGIGAPAIGQAQASGLAYKEIKTYIDRYEAKVTFDATYVVNYVTMGPSTWIAFDDVEAIQHKVSYAKKTGLLGYFVWQVTFDDNWALSKTAAQGGHEIIPPPQEDNRNGQKKQPYGLLVIVLPIIAAVILLLIGFVIYYRWMRKYKSKVQESRNQVNIATAAAAARDFSGNAPNLALYSLAYIEEATNRFSRENKLGEGGYGPVYKGVLQDGQEVAVKKLSKTSTQGFEEFKNEVMLTAKLQHVNLVKLLGFCIEREEHMLIYEYMPNRSLDYYLFDPIKKYKLDWKKRIHIIEGICQGLIYLQEYSRLTIIHRDLKASNVLLDNDMKPKISDFGMARIFTKDNLEANTERIVGTYGYAPPEYIKRGIYSTKSDVYSFGVLLLQIISGKRVSGLYGGNDHLCLLEYAYELWKDGKGMEFMDPSLEDTYAPCRLIRCLHIALLCVQEMPIERPSMLEVSWMLRNEATNLIMIPKKPALSKQTQKESSTSNSEIRSHNDATVSSMEAR